MNNPHSRTAAQVVTGADSYNAQLTGFTAKCIRSIKSDADHIPLAIFHDNGTRRQIMFNHENTKD